MSDKKTGNIEKVLAWAIYIGLLIMGLICCKNAWSEYIAAKTLLNLSFQSITQDDFPTITICYPHFHSFKVSEVKSWNKRGLGTPRDPIQITEWDVSFAELKTLEPNQSRHGPFKYEVNGCLKISSAVSTEDIIPDEYFYFALNFTGKEKTMNLSIYVTSEENSNGVVGFPKKRWYDGKVQAHSYDQSGFIKV